MSNNNCKANIDSILYHGTYLFMYNMKTTELGQFSDPEICYINNIQVCTYIVVKVQLQS